VKVHRSKSGAWIAGAYLLLVLVVCSPLITAGAIHHGNGIPFLGALVLTLPLSWIAFRVIDSLSGANAFYMVGAPYYRALAVLAGSAFVNAFVIYCFVGIARRKKSGRWRQPAK
jgi:hypothetical protein